MSTSNRAALAGALAALALSLSAFSPPAAAQEAQEPTADHSHHDHHDHHDHDHSQHGAAPADGGHDHGAHDAEPHEGHDHSGHAAPAETDRRSDAGHGAHHGRSAAHKGHGPAAHAHQEHDADAHVHAHDPVTGPAGVMLDHMHHAGSLMVGYRYSWSRQSGRHLNGTRTVSDHTLMHNACENPHTPAHEHCTMKQREMVMHMHMLDIMYAPTDWLTLMVMPHWMSMDMTMAPLGGHGGMHGGGHGHGTEGLGDTVFGALIKLSGGPDHHLHTGLLLSAPTGSTRERNAAGNLTHYMMQLGSGTWDALPSLTYTGRADRLSWGAQGSGVIRLEDENDQGYRLGNVFQATAWGRYRLTDWLSASVRVLYTHQGEIEGRLHHTGQGTTPADLPANYGGRFWDVGFGVDLVVPSGPLADHRLSVEWLEPLRDDVNGFQQARSGTLFLKWGKSF